MARTKRAVCLGGGRCVDCVLQRLAGGELGRLAGLDGHRLAGGRVAARALGAVGHREGAEADQLHRVAAGQGAREVVEGGVQSTGGVDLAEVRVVGDGGDEVGLVQNVSFLFCETVGEKS